MNDNSVIFMKDWIMLVKSLSNENQIVFWDLFAGYKFGEEQECDNEFVKPTWNFIKKQLDDMKQKYQDKIVERNRENGSKGGRPKKDVEKPKETQITKVNPKNPLGYLVTQKTPNENENENVYDNDIINTNTKYSFVEIKNFNKALNSFLPKYRKCFYLAYKFWDLWSKRFPHQKYIKEASVLKWTHEIRLILENDKRSIKSLLNIYFYFEDCLYEKSGFRDFWFVTLKSVGALRKSDNEGIYYYDKILDEVNSARRKSEQFRNYTNKKIEEFENYESTKLLKE